MRITYAVPRYLPHLGGVENHVLALATGARRAGHQVTVLTQQEGTAAPPVETVGGVVVRRYPSRWRMRGQGLSPRLWQAVRRLGGRSDVLHVHNLHAVSTLGTLVAARSPALVVTPHYLGSGAGRLDRTLHDLYDPVVSLGLRRASAFICVSRAEADEFRRHPGVDGARIHVIPNGVDEAVLRAPARPPSTDGDRVVLVAGRLEPYKQAEVAVRALAHLPERYSLVVAGAGPEEERLRRRADTEGVAPRVRFVGTLTSAEMAGWYRRSAVVVSMSRRECFGMTLAEGLAAGCAVVASDIPPHREVVESAGVGPGTLIPCDAPPRRLAEAITRADRGRADLRPTVPSWHDVVDATLGVYRQLQAHPRT